MKIALLSVLVAAGMITAAGAVHAGTVTFYDDETDFLDATDSLDLAFEDFETGFELTNPAHFASCIEPMWSASDDTCFAPGDLVPGFSITAERNNGGVVRMAPDVWDAGTHVVGAWPFQVQPSSFNPTHVNFEHGPTAVSADVYGVRLAPGVPTGDPEPVLVEVFGLDDALLDSLLVEPPAYDTPAFVGIVSSVPIGRVVYGTQLDDPENHAGEVIDNLYFGGGPGRLQAEAVDFGPHAVGVSDAVNVAVTNTGHLALEVGSIASPAAPFALGVDSCSGQSLAPGADCSLEVTFTPGWAQAFSATLEIPAAAPSEALSLALTGQGVVPRVGVTPARLDFGGVAVGATASAQTVTVTNPAGVDVEVSTIFGLDGEFASSGGSCGAPPVSLAPGASCTLEVEFSPVHPGRTAGAAVLIAGDQTGSTSVDLAGEGVEQ